MRPFPGLPFSPPPSHSRGAPGCVLGALAPLLPQKPALCTLLGVGGWLLLDPSRLAELPPFPHSHPQLAESGTTVVTVLSANPPGVL